MNGTAEKQNVEVKMVTKDGMLITVKGKNYFASFADFPFLGELPSNEIFCVEYCGHGHIRWDKADIDLNTDILANPDAFPISFQTDRHGAAVSMGKAGGMAKSVRKAASSRANGKKGGRPKKASCKSPWHSKDKKTRIQNEQRRKQISRGKAQA